MSTFTADFKPAVLSYINRPGGLFMAGSQDLVLLAANQAKALAQRKHKFQHAATIAKLNVTSADGVLLSTATDLAGSPIKIRSVDAAALYVTGGLIPINTISRSSQRERAKRLMEGVPTTTLVANNLLVNERPSFVQFGGTGMLWPWGAAQMLHLDVIQWMPEYVETTIESDFFLESCHDWMFYQTLIHLNYFLKEDERIPISDAMMKQAWEAVVNWDTDFINTQPILD